MEIPTNLNIRGNLSKEAIKRIQININNNNKKDLKTLGIKGILTYDEFMEKIKEQKNKCYICLQDLKYDGGNWCNFFPSADRINNKFIHSKENIAISCIYCNIRYFKQSFLKENINKKCGLCPGLNHCYDGYIISKSELYEKLEHSDYNIKQYIRNLNTDISTSNNLLPTQPT
jgi:hypothetical protein